MAARVFVFSTGRFSGQLAAASNRGGRFYAAAAEAAVARHDPLRAAGTARQVAAEVPEKKDVFWMREPKTGCWMPENHFGVDFDTADFYAQQLFSEN